jgi:aspartate racemase
MKTVGLLGGMSWESTQTYYRLLNTGVREALGGLHSAQIAMLSVDFAPLEQLQHRGDWDAIAQLLIARGLDIQAAGADFLVIATNTMHKVAAEVEQALSIPLLHIADATAEALVAGNISTVGLLGTAFTMEQAFYKSRLEQKYGLKVIVPNDPDRAIVHRVIYQELCQGEVRPESRVEYVRIIEQMAQEGAQGVILGCTEIGMLVADADVDVALFDTTAIHAAAAVAKAVG